MKKIDMIIFVIMTIAVAFLFFGCGKKEAVLPNPIVEVPIGCTFAPIPPLRMMVINPEDDIEIDLRIQEQSELKTSTLLKCKRPS
ncbi:MAG: hypothetical protein ACWGHH_06390 [Sulfurovaceae bacterium]